MTKPSRFFPVTPVALGAALFLAGCGKPPAQPAPPPPAVSVITVHPETIPMTQEYIGRGVSPYDVELRALVSGTLKERPMTDGAEVTAGDLLFVIDDIPFKASLANAQARVVQWEATAANAERNRERTQSLLETKAVSTKDVDDANTAMLNARAQLAAAQADVVSAKWNLDNTRITAPVSGRLGKANVVPGAPIAANTTLLVRLQQTDPIWVTFSIPESYLLRFTRQVKDGVVTNAGENDLRANLTLSDGSAYPIPGKMNFADVNLRTEVSAMEARAIFTNPEKRLKPGQFFTVHLSGPQKHGVFLVPQRAVQINPTNRYLYVVVKGKDRAGQPAEVVEARDVQTGEWSGDRWVIESGLHDGDRVVVEGFQNVQMFGGPGTAVTPGDYKPASPAPAAK